MRQCPGCGFLVPPSWEECEKCGADLADASVFRAGSTAGASATARTSVATPVAPVTPAGSADPPSDEHFDYFSGAVVPSTAPGSVSGVGDTPDLGSLESETVRPPGDARRARALTRLVYAVCAVVLVAAGWYGYGQITAEHVDLEPAAQEWVDGDRSVSVENALAGFRAELPASPEIVEQSMTVAGATYTVHLEMSQATPEYVAGVGYVDGPPGSEQELDALVADGGGAEFVSGGDTVSIDTTDHNGRRAVDVVAAVDDAATKVRMVPVGTRLYMAMIVTPYRSAPGFDRLVDNFELTGNPVGAS